MESALSAVDFVRRLELFCKTRRLGRDCWIVDSTSASARSMATSTKHRPVGKAPVRTPSIEAVRAGSGRCSRTATASPSAGPPRARTATICILLAPTLEHVRTARGLLADTETLHLDRGYDNRNVRHLVASVGITNLVCTRLRPTRHRDDEAAHPARPAMADRTDQQLAVELRPTPTQHRPAHGSPARGTRSRDRPAAHRKTDRLAQPLEPHVTPIPRTLGSSSHRSSPRPRLHRRRGRRSVSMLPRRSPRSLL